MIAQFLAFAASFIGVHERGDNCGPEVERFQKVIGGVAAGQPWCMAFAQFCVLEMGPTELYPSEHCLTVWEKSPEHLRIPEPRPGALVIWQMRETSAGHVGIVESVDGDWMQTIEGNTGPGAGVVREGDGVYRKRRAVHGSGPMKVVGFLMPFAEGRTNEVTEAG